MANEPVVDGPPPDSPAPFGSDLLIAALAGSAALVGSVALGAVAGVHLVAGLWVTEVVLFLAVSWAILRISGRSPVAHVGLGPWPLWPLLFGVAIGVANFFALVVPIQAIVQSVVPAQLREAFDSARIFKGRSHGEMALLISGVCAVAPFCEEFFFRGVVQRGLGRHDRPLEGIFTSALIFGLAHLDPVNFWALLELGLLFGVLYRRTGSIWPGIFAHSANNGVSALLFFVSGPESNEAPEIQVVIALGAIGGLALVGLSELARRYPALVSFRSGQIWPPRA